MRLCLLTLALLAAASPAAAQTPPEPEGEIYSAYGTEPFWGLTFEDGKMIYTHEDERIEVARPRPVTGRNGVHIYRTARMIVEISHEPRCGDGMSEYEFADTVRVRFGASRTARVVEGCGGQMLPPVTLANTDWLIVEIDGAPVGGENYLLSFDDQGRLSGQAGCNRLSGPYTQRGHILTPGAIAATRMACPAERMAQEAKVLQLLRGSVRISWRSGLLMTLQENNDGEFGTYVTLRRQ
jgi:heat shock protein HslJ